MDGIMTGALKVATETFSDDTGDNLDERIANSITLMDKSLGFCISESTDILYNQISSILIKYLDKNPETWHLPASDIALDAFRESFPCE